MPPCRDAAPQQHIFTHLSPSRSDNADRMCHAARTISCFGGYNLTPVCWNLSMPLYSVPRRPFRVQSNEPSPAVNWRRGLMRIWLLVSAAWIMGWVIYLIMNTAESGFRGSDLLVIPVLLFGPPVAMLLFGAAAGWAFKGFKMDEPPADNDR